MDAIRAKHSVDDYSYMVNMWDDKVVYVHNGDLYQVDYKFGDGEDVTLSNKVSVQEQVEYIPVEFTETFSADPKSSGDFVLYKGPIFRADTFPDKLCTITDRDLEHMARSFKASPYAPGDFEHMDTIMDGDLGGLVDCEKQGNTLFGTVKVPKWLHESVEKRKIPFKVSLQIGLLSKTIQKIAYVLNPRIEEATLVAAFKASKESEQVKKMDKIKNVPGFIERVKALFGGLPEGALPADDVSAVMNFTAEPEPPAVPVVPVVEPNAPDAPVADPNPNAGMMAAFARNHAELIFTNFLHSGKVNPAQKESLVPLMAQAVLDDGEGIVKFSADGVLEPGDRLKRITAMLESMPVNPLLSAQVRDFSVLHQGGEDPAKRTERIASFCKQTDIGKAALKIQKEASA